jgi:hypothetical protein
MPDAFRTSSALVGLAVAATAATAQVDLAGYFGFEEPRIVVVDDRMGPSAAADINNDGLNDLVVVNNSKSRIEVYLQRSAPRTQQEMQRDFKVNRLPPNPWFDREEVSVAHRISGFRLHDVDDDGMLDILYAGQPAELVVMRQTSPASFEQMSKRRVRGLSARQNGIAIADVMGSRDPELLAAVNGKIHVFGLTDKGIVGEPTPLGSSGEIVAFFVEDYNGDGLNDVLGVIPEDDAPLRLWMQSGNAGRTKSGLLGPEMRFEMPTLIEVQPIRFPDRKAASIGVIERASRRIVLYDITSERVGEVSLTDAASVERDATAEVFAFRGDDSDRSVDIADLDGDGLQDLLVTDADANAIVIYRQSKNVGFGERETFSAFKEPKTVVAGQWDDDAALEVFVLSEEEKAIGVSQWDPRDERLSFPQPIAIKTAGASPVAMGYGEFNGAPAVLTVVRDRRDHTLEIHRPDGEVMTIELEDVNRPPQSMLVGDFDGDGMSDALLFTPSEPMVMVRSTQGDEGVELAVLTDESMPQYGLVQAAGPLNTGVLDVDDDGVPELLIADENFVRATAFDATSGWRVVEQITMPDPATSLTGLGTLVIDGEPVIVASDRSSRELVLMSKVRGEGWAVVDRLRLTGMQPTGIEAGAFAGTDEPTVLCLADDAFAMVPLAGERVALEEFAAYRSDEEDRFEHEMEVGDVNGDGYIDIIVLDAREQMCQIFTLSASRKLYYALEFKVFESRIFSGGDARQFEPSAAIIEDITGDGATDLILEVHDRYILYPQATR